MNNSKFAKLILKMYKVKKHMTEIEKDACRYVLAGHTITMCEDTQSTSSRNSSAVKLSQAMQSVNLKMKGQ